MSGVTPPVPSITGYTAWLRSINIPVVILPDDSPYISASYWTAFGTVNKRIQLANPWMYETALYNLATDVLLNIAQDINGQTVFRDKRAEYKILGWTPGVIQTSSNAGTAESLLNPEFLKTLLMADLQNLKTPYGRTYLTIAVQVGVPWVLV